MQHVHGNHFIPNTVLVDCTADSVIASHYYDWLRKGIHVVTPNKKANSGPLDQVIIFLTCGLLITVTLNSPNFCFWSLYDSTQLRKYKSIPHSLIISTHLSGNL